MGIGTKHVLVRLLLSTCLCGCSVFQVNVGAGPVSSDTIHSNSAYYGGDVWYTVDNGVVYDFGLVAGGKYVQYRMDVGVASFGNLTARDSLGASTRLGDFDYWWIGPANLQLCMPLKNGVSVYGYGTPIDDIINGYFGIHSGGASSDDTKPTVYYGKLWGFGIQHQPRREGVFWAVECLDLSWHSRNTWQERAHHYGVALRIGVALDPTTQKNPKVWGK